MTPSTKSEWEERVETLNVPSGAFIAGRLTESATTLSLPMKCANASRHSSRT